jgi:hypothetical protein
MVKIKLCGGRAGLKKITAMSDSLPNSSFTSKYLKIFDEDPTIDTKTLI